MKHKTHPFISVHGNRKIEQDQYQDGRASVKISYQCCRNFLLNPVLLSDILVPGKNQMKGVFCTDKYLMQKQQASSNSPEVVGVVTQMETSSAD